MDFTLYLGDYAYSSWSLRGWVLLDAFGIAFTPRYAHLQTSAFEEMGADMAPARLVPALAVSDAARAPVLVWDTLAIAETVHDYHPQAGLWPKGERARPVARSIVAEMHSGFGALRSACPMNMNRAYQGFPVTPEIEADLGRLSVLWAYARARRTAEGPYLFGAFSAVDAFFAPVASRIATYDLPMGDEDMAYVRALLAHPSVRRWRAMGVADNWIAERYEMDLPQRPNPHVPPLTGRVVTTGQAENAVCPFSGCDVVPEGLVDIGGRIVGFCNPFCRDKVAADPLAWPEVEAMF